MAETTYSDLFVPEVSLDYFRQAFVNKLDLIGKFIGIGDDSPIRMVNNPVFGVEGHYIQGPLFKRISSLVTRRDVTSVADTTPLELTGANNRGVKLHRKIGPVNVSRDAAFLSRATQEQIWAEIGTQAGEQLAVNIQTSILAAIRGIIAGMTSTAHTLDVWDAATRTNMSPSLLSRGKAKMADNRSKITKGLMHSDVWHDLFLDAQGRGYDSVGGSVLRTGEESANHLGLEFGMIDDTYLTTADAGFDKYHTILLGAGAMEIQFTRPMVVYPIFQNTLTEQVIERWRADADFSLRAPHTDYDVTDGGVNPTDANLASSANWIVTYTSHKEVPLVEVVSNSSLN